MNLPKWTNLRNNLLSLGPGRSRVAEEEEWGEGGTGRASGVMYGFAPRPRLARREPGEVQEVGQDLEPAAGASHGDTG